MDRHRTPRSTQSAPSSETERALIRLASSECCSHQSTFVAAAALISESNSTPFNCSRIGFIRSNSARPKAKISYLSASSRQRAAPSRPFLPRIAILRFILDAEPPATKTHSGGTIQSSRRDLVRNHAAVSNRSRSGVWLSRLHIFDRARACQARIGSDPRFFPNGTESIEPGPDFCVRYPPPHYRFRRRGLASARQKPPHNGLRRESSLGHSIRLHRPGAAGPRSLVRS